MLATLETVLIRLTGAHSDKVNVKEVAFDVVREPTDALNRTLLRLLCPDAFREQKDEKL